MTPTTAKALLEAGYKINVERSPVRIFDDEEFEAVGASLVPEGSWVDAPDDAIILGLKELLESDGMSFCHPASQTHACQLISLTCFWTSQRPYTMHTSISDIASSDKKIGTCILIDSPAAEAPCTILNSSPMLPANASPHSDTMQDMLALQSPCLRGPTSSLTRKPPYQLFRAFHLSPPWSIVSPVGSCPPSTYTTTVSLPVLLSSAL